MLTKPQRQSWAAARSERRRHDFEVSRALCAAVDPSAAATWSLSHSRGFATVATAARGAIGVDLEHCVPRDAVSLAATAFTPAEASLVRSRPDPVAQADVFYDLWVLKEACAKALSRPLTGILQQVDFSGALERGAAVAGAVLRGRAWVAWVYAPRADLRLAVFLADADASDEPRTQEWPVRATDRWAMRHRLVSRPALAGAPVAG